MPTEEREVVTITFYGSEATASNGERAYDPKALEAFESQIANILTIQRKLTEAAEKAHRPPPTFELSLFIKPNWSDPANQVDSPFKEEGYIENKNKFLVKLKQKLDEAGSDHGIVLKDFIAGAGESAAGYEPQGISEDEAAYLQNLESKGSIADVLKNRALIDNAQNRHLQLDSNTLIYNFEQLYQQTFGKEEQTDAFNAACYASDFVAVHNKIVYLAPSSLDEHSESFAKKLKVRYEDWISQHKSDLPNTREKQISNSMYNKVFALAASDVGLAHHLTDQMLQSDGTQSEIDRSPAILNSYKQKLALDEITGLFSFDAWHNEMAGSLLDDARQTEILDDLDETSKDRFRLTSNVITSISQTWKKQDDAIKALIKAQNSVKVEVGDAIISFPAVFNIIKKYTAPLRFHELYDRHVREHIKAISNEAVERYIVEGFFKEMMRQNNSDVLKSLFDAIPNTKLGEQFCQHFFNVSRAELIRDPQSLQSMLETKMDVEDLQELIPEVAPQLQRQASHSPTSIVEMADNIETQSFISPDTQREHRGMLATLRDPKFSPSIGEEEMYKTCSIARSYG